MNSNLFWSHPNIETFFSPESSVLIFVNAFANFANLFANIIPLTVISSSDFICSYCFCIKVLAPDSITKGLSGSPKSSSITFLKYVFIFFNVLSKTPVKAKILYISISFSLDGSIFCFSFFESSYMSLIKAEFASISSSKNSSIIFSYPFFCINISYHCFICYVDLFEILLYNIFIKFFKE